MALEHGFRRIVIVMSVLLLGLGITLDATSMLPHATVEVTMKDGRKFTLERHEPKERLMDRDDLTKALPGEAAGPPVLLWDPDALGRFRKAYPQYDNIPDLELARRIRAKPELNSKWNVTHGEFRPIEILDVRATRGPAYWWWADSEWTKVAAVWVLALWIVFSVVRWIVHGFARS